MIAFLLGIFLLAQGTAPLPTNTGTVTGVLKTPSGDPASGIRVTALARQGAATEISTATDLASIAATDERGRFRLENIAPGNYYIAAGRVDHPTYFPGTLEILKGTVVVVKSAELVSGIDFTLEDFSVRTATSDSAFSGSQLTLPVQVRMENDVKQPVIVGGRSILLRLSSMTGQTEAELPIVDSIQNLTISNAVPGRQYRLTVGNLPQGYVVKSMIQDGVDLLNNPLNVTARNFAQSTSSIIGATAPGAYSREFSSNAGAPMTTLEITLASASASGQATPSASGVRVLGRAASSGLWYPSISGNPGVFFTDGSFEFRGVAAGRHVILLQDKPASPSRILAASIVVGNRDLDEVLAEDTQVLPAEVRFSAGTPPPGLIPLAWIRGRVSNETSRQPVLGGVVTLTGKTTATFPIDNEGQFQIPRLLPGSYELTIAGFQHTTTQQRIVVGDEDVLLNVGSRSIN